MASSSDSRQGGSDLLQTAEQVWGALDKMLATDPEGYKKFIKKQIEEGEEVMASPEPVMCLRCGLEGGKARYLYLNVCKWIRVPKPKTDDDPVPVKGGVVRHLLYKESKRKTRDLLYDVAFNPFVVEECTKLVDLEDMLISLCLDYLENETNLKIANRKDCRKLEVSHKGILSDICSSIDEQRREFLTPESRLDIGDSILTQLREMKLKRDDDDTTLPELRIFPNKASRGGGVGIRTHHSNDNKGPTPLDEPHPLDAPTAKPLIQELRSTMQETYQDKKDRGRVCVPEHSVTVKQCEEGGEEGSGREMCVKVMLPGVKTAKEVDLEVSENDLVLTVDGRYHLNLQFPECMAEESVRATFSSKQSSMTVSLPYIHHNPSSFKPTVTTPQ